MATFNVSASWSKPSYTAGETIAGTISGDATRVEETTTISTGGPVDIPVVSTSGAQSVVSLPTVSVTTTTMQTVTESVLIDPSRPIVDSSPNPRTWQVSADRKSITAVA